jgi:hypothetical protein
MGFFRRVVGRVALASLLIQALTLAAVPAALLAHVESALECTCSHGDHAFCPMHHPRPVSHGRCAMRGTPDAAAVLVQALCGWTGAVPRSPETPLAPRAAFVAFFPATTFATPHALQPDAPPPRG